MLFSALGGALHDAAVAPWDAKRAIDSVRPVSAIPPRKAWAAKRSQEVAGDEGVIARWWLAALQG